MRMRIWKPRKPLFVTATNSELTLAGVPGSRQADCDHHVKFSHRHLRECYDLQYFRATAGLKSRNRSDMVNPLITQYVTSYLA